MSESKICETKCPNLALIFATGYLNKYVRICVKISTPQNAGLDVSICVLFLGNCLKYLEDLYSDKLEGPDNFVLWNDG